MQSIEVFKSQTKQRHQRGCKNGSCFCFFFLELAVIEMFRNRAMAKVAPLRVQKNFFFFFFESEGKRGKSIAKDSWLPQIQGRCDNLS